MIFQFHPTPPRDAVILPIHQQWGLCHYVIVLSQIWKDLGHDLTMLPLATIAAKMDKV